MADRIFDRTFDCGCQLSSDGGGACIPCCYPGYGATKQDIEKCTESWKKWKKSDDYQKHLKEIQERNR